MALQKKINNKASTDETTGFGTNSSMYGGRLYDKNGQPNIRKTGIPWLERNSWYHIMLQMNYWKFLLTIFGAYTTANLFFAMVYLLVGIDKLEGIEVTTPWEKFAEAFFFSAQTFTTVGYGRISPTGWLVSFIASTEALIGLLSFAVATGLIYGRFSKPNAFLKFSHHALIAPYKDEIAFMMRFVPYKNNYLTDAEAKITLAMTVEEDGKQSNRFYPMKLELGHVNALTLNWTLVHLINEESPFYDLSKEDLAQANAEILVTVKGFDDTFSNTVIARSSYRPEEIVVGAKFKPMYYKDAKGGTTVLNLDQLDAYESVDISYTQMMRV